MTNFSQDAGEDAGEDAGLEATNHKPYECEALESEDRQARSVVSHSPTVGNWVTEWVTGAERVTEWVTGADWVTEG